MNILFLDLIIELENSVGRCSVIVTITVTGEILIFKIKLKLIFKNKIFSDFFRIKNA